MQLTIGSNRLRNTDGIVSVRGDEQIKFEWGPSYAELLLTMDLYNVSGYHIARLRRNQWTFNDRDRFRFVGSAKRLNLVDTKSEQVVLEARVVGGDSVVVTQGAFHNSKGHPIEIAMEHWPDVENSQESEVPAAHSTGLPFARVEIAAIRKALESAQATVECPLCGCPLTMERIPSETQLETQLVSCIICRRNLVVSRQS